jgi:hypothetical protein
MVPTSNIRLVCIPIQVDAALHFPAQDTYYLSVLYLLINNQPVGQTSSHGVFESILLTKYDISVILFDYATY